jgi:uncharacterized damage-inducible protein DinB
MTYYSGKDLARSFRTVRNNTIQMAQDIPEDKYSFRPTPDTRSVAELLQHVISISIWQLALHGKDKKTFVTGPEFGTYIQHAATESSAFKTKAELVSALHARGDEFAAWLESLSDATLGESVGFPAPLDPPQKSRFEMLLGVKEHEMHHRGQLMLMQRMLGIVPHLTRARQARA